MKKIISIVLACALLLSMIAVQAEDEVTSGVCGENMTWRYEGNALYIEGTGTMYDFEDGKMPWVQFINEMKKVVISDGITSIGRCAFCRFGGITELYLPDSIETIGQQAFFRALNMEELKMPANLKSVDFYAFRYTKVYRYILNPNASYAGWSFEWAGIGELEIPKGMTSIPSNMFPTNDLLKKLTLNEGLVSIGTNAFDGCTALETLTFPNSVSSLGNTAFSNCTKLNEVVVLNSSMQYGKDVFKGDEQLTLIAEAGSTTEEYANANGINFKAMDTIGSNIKWFVNKGILRIEGNGAIPNFDEGAAPWNSEAGEIASVRISEGITTIGSYAFADIGEIEDISLPTTLSRISETSFGDMELFKIIREISGIDPLGTTYAIRVLKNDNNAYSLMLGVTVYEEEMGEDGIYLKTKNIKFIPAVIEADKKGIVNFIADTAGSDETNVVKTFLWKYPYMTDFKTNAEQGANELPSEEYAYINDGKIKISGSLGSDASGEATLLIVPADCDMLSEEAWMNASPVHADSQIIYGNGEYEFNVAFAEEGEYKAYIGNPSLKSPREITLVYTNKANSEQAISELNAATSAEEVRAILNNKMSLQLFSELYDTVIADEELVESASEVLLDYLKDETVKDGAEAQAAIYKSFVIALINSDKLDDITEYADEVFVSDTEVLDYIKFTKSDKITEIVKSRNSDSIEQFDENYAEGILRVLIQYNNGTDEIKKALTKYADLLGIKESKITKAVCLSVAGKKFSSLDEIAEYVNGYKAPSSGGGNGGSGGGGGLSTGGSSGGSSVKNNNAADRYSNRRYETTASETVSAGAIDIKPFDDLEGYEWAESSIENLFKKGIVSGKSEKSFCPQDKITREEFAKLVMLAVNINVKSGTVPFEDVSKEDWFYDYVKTLYSAGVIAGISDTMFGTGTNITRQDAVVMIDRAMEKCSLIEEDYEKVGDFNDSFLISDYALESVNRLKSNGMITGDENNNFNPEDSITRAESAVLIFRVYEKAAAAN